MIEKIDTVVVGGGQAGLAMSYHLKQSGREHVVLERVAQPKAGGASVGTVDVPVSKFVHSAAGFSYETDDPDGYVRKTKSFASLNDTQR
jgi:putative flavoprotein involved in K+ transport